MTPTYLNSSPSPYPLALGDDHYHHVYNPQASSSSSSPPPPSQVLTYSFQDQGVVNYPREVHQLKYQQDQGNFLASQGENDHGGLNFWIPKKEDESKDQMDHKWMPPKLRLIRKMKNADQARVEAPISPQPVKLEDEKQASSSTEIDGSNNSPIRVCSDCNTTKTPLWRSGPRGPKSLCNACGIRQRKARRAMAAAAAAAAVSGADLPAETSPAIKAKVVHHKKKRSNTNVNGHNAQHFKRRPKLLASTTTTTSSVQSQGKKQLCFEEFLISLNKSLAIHQVFPQDEKEAAILLMALSCHDLVHG